MDQQTLREYLTYDPETGVFTWKKRASLRTPVGTVAGHKCGKYLRLRLKGVSNYAHRWAFLYMEGALPSEVIDHINGDTHDNRWVNLRPASCTINGMNAAQRKDNTSGITGVCQVNGKWRADIKVAQKNIYLGTFTSFVDAATARKQAEQQHGFHPNHGRKAA
jgi:hypothetical protein